MLLGETPEETTQNLKMVVEFFLAQRIIPVIIGGSRDLSIGQYKAYEFLGQAINLAVIDERIDIDHADDAPPRQTWLLDIFSHEPNYLFNYSALACQGHFVNNGSSTPSITCTLIPVGLADCGTIFSSPNPRLRDADMVSFDLCHQGF